jgi:hypothetical protein
MGFLLKQRELSASGVQLGYRALWRRIRRKYKAVVSRKTVMMALRQIDPVDSMSRKQHKLQRRVYYNKVLKIMSHLCTNKVLIFLGSELCLAYRWV